MSTPPWTAKAAFHFFRSIGWLSVVFIFIALVGDVPSGLAQATNFAISSTAKLTGAKHLGINLAGANTYDSGQMMKNLIFQNPGFEGETWQSILNCVVTSPTTCQDADEWSIWPANFLQGATFEFIYGAAKGQTGTISGNSAGNYLAGYGITVTFSAPLSPAPAVGDYLIVRMTKPGNAQAGWQTNTWGGATISTDTTDIAPDSPGKQALAMNAAQSGQSANAEEGFDTTNGRSFVQLKGSYTVAFKAKGVAGNNQLNVSITRLGTPYGNENFINQNVTLTNQWQDYSYNFSANEDGTYVGPVQMAFSIAGASIYLDDVSITPVATPGNPTNFRDEVVARLKSLQPGVIRYMDEAMLGSSIDNSLAPEFGRQRAGFDEGQTENDGIGIGLPEFLALCQEVGAEPWFNVPTMVSTTEMQNLIQYLAGDASTPYGAIRAAQGQTAPWTSVFPTIHLELGNEVWNGGAFWGQIMLNSAAYGARAATIFAAARSTPGYDPTKFDLVLGSQAVNPGLTQYEMNASSGYDSVDGAPYIFNSFNDDSSNEAIYGPMFAQPEQVDSTASGYMAQSAQVAGGGNTPSKVDVYEVNLGATQGTASQNMETSVLGSVGGGIAVADHMLLMMRDDGITTQNMFALPEYINGYNNTATGQGGTAPLWGSIIDMGGETNASRPTFLAEQLANSAILPTMLTVTTTGSNPTWNQPLSTNDNVQLNNAHYLQSFAFTNGTQNSVVVFNLSRSGSLPVTFSGPNAPSGDVLVSQLTSTNITDNNENLTSATPVVNTTHTNVSNFNPAAPYSLPPYSMTVFYWPGSTLPPSATNLTANPTSTASGQTVTLTATVTSQSGTTTPTGTVTFYNGAASLGSGSLDANGTAPLSTTALPAGTDSITASYGGDSNDAGSTSSSVAVTITSNAAATKTLLTSSAASISTGQQVTFTATVSLQSGSAIPAGNVVFLNGTAQLGTAALNASGVAVFNTTALPAGADSITASYTGNTSDAASTSSSLTVNVTQTVSATTTALVSSATSATPGQSVTFTATVSPQSGRTVPTGTVTFLDGSSVIGSGTLSSSGAASLSITSLASGQNSITASYGGDSGDAKSVSPVVLVTISPAAAATTTKLTSSSTAINAGQNVVLTAAVAAQSGSGIPSGTVAFEAGSTILGTATLNASGVATISTTALPAGADPVTANYAGSSSFGGSVSAPLTITVTQQAVATTTSLSASGTNIGSGQSVTFTAVVTPQSGTAAPSGTLTFLDGTTVLSTASLNSSGAASFSTTALAAGSHSITASYGGSSSNLKSVSNPVAVTVAQGLVPTATKLGASPQSINSGQSVTLTATVTPQTGTVAAAGVVSFSSGGTVLGTASLNAAGVAILATTSLPSGTDPIVASYGGSSTDAASTSSAISVTVTQTVVPTTTALLASATQIISGQPLVLTATVSPQSGSATPAGTINFLDGGTVLGSAPLNGGVASLSVSTLSASLHTLTASYGGSSANSASVSGPVNVTVASAPVQTVTTLASSSTSLQTGQSVTFTASVTPKTGGGNVPLLPVAFLDGSTIIGTASVNANGVATFTTNSLPAGADAITASYQGNKSDLSSVSAAMMVNVTQAVAATSTSLSSSASQVSAGQSVTFTAIVSPQSGSNVPTGSVTFMDGGLSLGSAALNASGVAYLSTTSLPPGTESVVASYGGDKSDSSSSSRAVTIAVTGTTQTALTASASSINTGQSVTFTATVASKTGGSVPTGSVAFLDGSSIMGTAALNGSGIAVFTTSALPAGAQAITASYQGTATEPSSTSQPVTVSVTQSLVTTNVSLTASASQINSGESVIFTAVVLPSSGGAGPTGSVTFLDGSTVLGTASLNAGGSAFFSTSSLAIGTQSITASYSGSTTDGKSVSAPLSVAVNQSVTATRTMLTVSATQITYGDNVTFTAVVTPQTGSAIPSGTVALLNGSAIIATTQLNASGVAIFNTRALAVGDTMLTASYEGTSKDSSSVSAPVTVAVLATQGPTGNATTTFLTASPTSITAGQSVTLTATVVPQFATVPNTGSVTFFDGVIGLGTASVNSNGAAVLTVSSLAVGNHSLLAIYSGGGTDDGSTSSTIILLVNAVSAAGTAPPSTPAPALATTTTTLIASASQISAGDPISLTATVTAPSGDATPAGTVQFFNGQISVGSAVVGASGSAVFTSSSLAAGTYNLTASYAGSATDAASTSAPVSFTVASLGTPGYTMSVSTSDVVVTAGQVANLTVTLTPENGFDAKVNLSCSGMPPGTSCSFSPPTITPSGQPVSSTLSILANTQTGTTSTAQSRAPKVGPVSKVAFGLVMPWGLLSLAGLTKRKNRSRAAVWMVRMVVAAALIAGSLWISGCGYSVNGSVFTMTLTSSGNNVPTHTSQITVSVQ